MTFAVLLPVYGRDDPDRFDAALSSIESQEGLADPLRIYIGVDGPLSSQLEAVLERHGQYLHKCIRHSSPIGPTRTLNSLVDALGDERLVFRMDADDVSRHDRMKLQAEYMDRNPDIAIVGSAIEEIDDTTGNVTTRRFPTDPDRIPSTICIACPLAHPSVCMRPDVLKLMNGYPDVRGQDLALWFHALAQGFRIANLDQPLVRMHVSRTFYERRSDPVRMWPEFRIYLRGIWELHGVTWRFVFPIARLAFRLVGPTVARRVYESGFRNRFAR